MSGHDRSTGRAKPQFAQGDNGVWTVNSLQDPGDGTCDDTECTLREAIAAAAAGDSIVFASGLQGAIALTAGELSIIDKSLSIDGTDRIVIDAQGNSRVISIVGDTVRLARLKLINGNTPNRGAGIFANDVVLALDGVTVSNNTTGQEGGGICINSVTTVMILNSTISGNSAQRGGGIVNQGSLTVVNSTISSNRANGGGPFNSTAGGGGGILNEASLTVIASTISGSTALVAGAAIRNLSGASATIVRSTISGNTSTSPPFGVGGIYNLGTLDLRSSTVTGNTG